ETRPRLLQYHEVLHRGLPRGHPHHRQRDHPAQGARRDGQLRPRCMGSAPDSSDGPGFAGPVRAPVKGTASIRITVRAAFMAAAALVLTVALFSVVIVPAIDRGGVGELVRSEEHTSELQSRF